MDAARVRIGLIGLGDIGLTQHLPALLRSDAVEVVAVADRDASRRALADTALAGRTVEVLDDADALLHRDLDAVVIATPPWITPALTIAALERGRYVLAEKPLAVGLDEALVLERLPAPMIARMQLGLTYRHDLAIARLHEAVTSGELGDGPLLVHASIYDEANRPGDPEHTTRITAALDHGDPSLHEGAHVFDWLAAILGNGPEVVADAWAITTLDGSPTPNLVGARLRYPGGTVANVEFGWLIDVLPPGFIRITGSRGSAELDLADFDLEIATAGGTERFVQEAPKMTRCFDRQLESFVELVRGRIPAPAVGVADGISTLRISRRIAELVSARQEGGRA